MLSSLNRRVSFVIAAFVLFIHIYAAVPKNETVKKNGSASITSSELESIAQQIQDNSSGILPQSVPGHSTQTSTTARQSSTNNDSTWNIVLNNSNTTPRYISFTYALKPLQKKAITENLVAIPFHWSIQIRKFLK